MIKGKKKIFVAIFLLFLVLFPFSTSTYAAINKEYGDNGSVQESDLDGKMKNNVLLDAIAQLIYALASWVEYLVGAAFQMLTGANMFPWADKVIFNTIPFLDVNFLNPASGSLFETTSGDSTPLANIVVSIYSTIFTLAVAFLGVVVGLMAIKLAVSSLASEKAKYKEALMKFLFSIVALFGMHYAMSFIFYINESLVEMASSILTENLKDVPINFDFVVNREEAVDKFFEMNETAWHDEFWYGSTYLLNEKDRAYIGLWLVTYDSVDQIKDSGDFEKIVDTNINKVTGISNKQMAGYLISDKNYADGVVSIAAGGKNSVDIADYANGVYAKALLTDAITTIQDGTRIDELRKDIESIANLNKDDVTDYVYYLFKEVYHQTYGYDTNAKYDRDAAMRIANNEFFNKKKEEFAVYKGATGKKNNEIIWSSIGIEEANFDNTIKVLEDFIDYAKGVSKYNYNTIVNYYDIYVAKVKGKPSDSDAFLSNMGQYFKEKAWTYDVDENGNIAGWSPNKVSLQGAILYAMFIIQSIMFFFAYIKRFFYVVILALLAPVIVIYDFLGKVAS